MKQAVLPHEQQFYINGVQLSGVQSINGGYSISEKPINVLGYGHVDFGFNQFGEGAGNPNLSATSQGLVVNDGSNVESEIDIGIMTDGVTISDEKPGEDYDFRRNSPFVITSDDGFLLQPYKSMAVVNSPLEGSFSIDSLLISEDFMVRFTGDNPFTGSMHHGGKYFGFYSGYINSHSISCDVGAIPVTSTDITVFGDIGGNPNYFTVEEGDGSILMPDELGSYAQEGTIGDFSASAKGDGDFPEIKIPDHGSITLTVGGAETDRITSFNHKISVGLSPIYVIGSSTAVQVDVTWPITTDTSFTIEIDNYDYGRLKQYLLKPTLHDLEIKIHDCFGRKIQHYTVIQARLISEQVSASVEGRLTVNLAYKSYYNKKR